MSNFVDIGVDFCKYLTSLSPQIKDGMLQWYLAGSLATTIVADAKKITEIKLDSDNKVIGNGLSIDVTEEQKEKLTKFSRKLGGDIDVVNVNGNMFDNAPLDNRPNIQNIIRNVPNVLDLMSWNPLYRGSMYIDSLECDRNISQHCVSIIETSKGPVVITSLPEQLAYKLSETLLLSDALLGKNSSEKREAHYKKDIRDLSAMFYGFKDLYNKEDFLNRVFSSLKGKENSMFAKEKLIEDSIIQKIINDSMATINEFSQDNSNLELRDFLTSLFSMRKKSIEKNDNKTPLQRREEELSKLEIESKEYDKIEMLLTQKTNEEK